MPWESNLTDVRDLLLVRHVPNVYALATGRHLVEFVAVPAVRDAV